MPTVWKTELKIQDRQRIKLPAGSHLLHVALQHEVLCLWFVCDPENPPTEQEIEIAGTGHPLDVAARSYLGTFMVDNGTFVFHVFHRHP